MKELLRKTTKSIFFVTIFFLLQSSLALCTAHADFQRTKIAVLDFELIGGKLETADMGAILSEWFITSIVKSGRFDVVERAMLQKILSEQKLSSTGIIDENSATALGKILGVKVVITGSVLKLRDTIEINSRVISVESGSIIAAENIRGNSDSDLHSLVDQLTSKIMRNFPLTGYVVKKNPTSVIIDLGLDAGLASGTEFIVYKEGEIIKHPKTGEVLDVEQILTGKLRITKVSKNVAEGAIISEEPGGIVYGHLVKSIQKEAVSTPPAPVNKGIAEAEPVINDEEQSPKSPPAPAYQRPVQEIKPNKKKSVYAVAEPVPAAPPATIASQPPVSKETLIEEKAGDYKAAIFRWELQNDATTFGGILFERIFYRLGEIPGLRLAYSHFPTKGVPTLSDVDQRSLLSGGAPNLSVLRQIGKEKGFNVAILGRMNIYCKWADQCHVRTIDLFIVNLATGKVIAEAGTDYSMDARDYIDLISNRAFKKFVSDMKK